MRAMWKRIVTKRPSLHLFLRMHLLRKLFERNEKPMSELRRGTDASAAAESRRTIIEMREPAGTPTLRIFAWLCAPAYSPLIPILDSALSRICCLRQLSHVGKEGGRLADEKPHIRKELERTHGHPLRLRRSNDRTPWKVSAQERTGFRHDQVIREQLVGDVQVGKCH